MGVWDDCAVGAGGAPQTSTGLTVLEGAKLPILNTVPALQKRGFDIPNQDGYLAPQQHETVSILYDGIWSRDTHQTGREQERLWLYVKDSTGQQGWIHRCMVLPAPAQQESQ